LKTSIYRDRPAPAVLRFPLQYPARSYRTPVTPARIRPQLLAAVRAAGSQRSGRRLCDAGEAHVIGADEAVSRGGAQRKLRYARLLTEAIDLGRVPRPLGALLAAVWVRDVTYQEDKSLGRTGNAPRVMASLPSLAISLLRLDGHANIAAADRHHARDPQRTLKLLLTA
jgi:hypothetical protein